jgi:P-type Cu+ transporter
MSIGILRNATLLPQPTVGGGHPCCSEASDLNRVRQRRPAVLRAATGGLLASTGLLGAYLAILTLASGRQFAIEQFVEWWPFVLALTIGFGVQVGLFIYLVSVSGAAGSGKVVATTGVTSTVAMVSCCTHYLVNLLPVLGATGLVGFFGQYQAELFWFGIASNLAGVVYLGSRTYSIIKGA